MSPISQRSMWKIMAPFSRVMDWNCGEKGSRRPMLESGIGVVGERAGGDVLKAAWKALLPAASSRYISSP